MKKVMSTVLSLVLVVSLIWLAIPMGASADTVYGITVAETAHGNVYTSLSTASAGDKVSVYLFPDENYQLKQGTLKLNGTALTSLEFTMPAEDAEITAEFEAASSKTATGMINWVEDGAIDVSEEFNAQQWGDPAFTSPKLKDPDAYSIYPAFNYWQNGNGGVCWNDTTFTVYMAYDSDYLYYALVMDNRTKAHMNNNNARTNTIGGGTWTDAAGIYAKFEMNSYVPASGDGDHVTSVGLISRSYLQIAPDEYYDGQDGWFLMKNGTVQSNSNTLADTEYSVDNTDATRTSWDEVAANSNKADYTYTAQVRIAWSDLGYAATPSANDLVAMSAGITMGNWTKSHIGGAAFNADSATMSNGAGPYKLGYPEVSFEIEKAITGTGDVTLSAASAKPGDTVTFTVVPGENQVLVPGTLKLNGVAIGGTATSFTMPNGKATFTAEFKDKDSDKFKVLSGSLTGGKIYASADVEDAGATVKLYLVPDSGMMLKQGSLKMNGEALSTLSFIMPKKDVTITAEFVAAPARYSTTVAGNADYAANGSPYGVINWVLDGTITIGDAISETAWGKPVWTGPVFASAADHDKNHDAPIGMWYWEDSWCYRADYYNDTSLNVYMAYDSQYLYYAMTVYNDTKAWNGNDREASFDKLMEGAALTLQLEMVNDVGTDYTKHLTKAAFATYGNGVKRGYLYSLDGTVKAGEEIGTDNYYVSSDGSIWASDWNDDIAFSQEAYTVTYQYRISWEDLGYTTTPSPNDALAVAAVWSSNDGTKRHLSKGILVDHGMGDDHAGFFRLGYPAGEFDVPDTGVSNGLKNLIAFSLFTASALGLAVMMVLSAKRKRNA